MANQRFPIFSEDADMYGENGSVQFPLAVVEKIAQTDKARLLFNTYTNQQAWFPESVFLYHWHVVSLTELQVFVSIPARWIQKKRTFFEQHKLL